MADYHSLLARAVAALPVSTPESRRSIYERARKALLGQLRLLDPPPAEADIQRESVALDAAIARLEAELAAPKPLPAAAHKAAQPPPPGPAPVVVTVPKPAPVADVASPLPVAAHARTFAEQAPVARAEQPVAETPAVPLRPRSGAPRAAMPAAPAARGRKGRMIAIGALVAIVAGGVATAAYLLPNPPFDSIRPKPPIPVAAKPADPKASKIVERVGAAAAPGVSAPPPVAPLAAAPAPAPAAQPQTAQPDPAPPAPVLPVEQRAALLLENPADAQHPLAYTGTVVWRLENIPRAPGQPVQTAVRADIDIPEARLKGRLVFQNNLDETFSASHTMQLRFTLGADSPAAGFKAIALPQMRDEGAPQGTPLIGSVAPIKDNLFLVALSQGDALVARNQDMIRTRPWIDVPMLTVNDRQSKLALEKGPAGERLINEAFASWQK